MSAVAPLARSSASPGPTTPILAVHGLRCRYGRIEALHGVDLELAPGELVALVGANGAGKTTLLRAISGLLPLAAGSIRLRGDDIGRLAPDRRVRRGICQVPEGRQVFGPMSVADNLRLGAYSGRAPANLDTVYDLFPVLRDKRDLPAGGLSGGQQQMLAIGRALMGRPELLLLDEPSMGLAPLLVEEILRVIADLRDGGMSILLVEQNAQAALAIADRGYVLETGSITMSGRGQDLLASADVQRAYLGM